MSIAAPPPPLAVRPSVPPPLPDATAGHGELIGTLAYATPLAAVPAPQLGPVAYRDGSTLVVPDGLVIARCCVKCNAPAEGDMLICKVSWCHRAYWLLGALWVTFFQQTGRVALGLCAAHRRKRTRWIIFGWTSPLIAAAIVVLSVKLQLPQLYAIAFLFGVSCVVLSVSRSRLVVATRIDPPWLRLKGACPEFLAELPSTG